MQLQATAQGGEWGGGAIELVWSARPTTLTHLGVLLFQCRQLPRVSRAKLCPQPALRLLQAPCRR